MKQSDKVRERAYYLWCLFKKGDPKLTSHRKIAQEMTKELRLSKILAPHESFHHTTITRWEKKYNWQVVQSNQNEETKSIDIMNHLPSEKKTITEDDLSDSFIVSDLKQDRLANTVLRKKIKAKLISLLDSAKITEDGFILNERNLSYLKNLASTLATIEKAMEHSDELFGVQDFIQGLSNKTMTEEEVVDHLFTLPKRQRDYVLATFPEISNNPKIKFILEQRKDV